MHHMATYVGGLAQLAILFLELLVLLTQQILHVLPP